MDMRIVEYLDERGKSPFAGWFHRLDPVSAARVTIQLERLKLGNQTSIKSLGRGLHEIRIDVGPGYRIYLARQGDALVILLAAGSKHRQDDDIATARLRLEDYRRRRKEQGP